jgi:hypothetical protein
MRRYALAVVAMLIACNPRSRAGGQPARLPPDADGPIRLHPEHPHSFRFRGQPTSLIGCSEHSGAVLNGAFDAIPDLDEPQRQGFNSPGKLGGPPWGIICSRPVNRSKIRPDASGVSVQCPRGMRVPASLLLGS